MLKISRLIRTVAELFHKKNHPFSHRFNLVLIFLKLEFLTIFKIGKNKQEVTARIAGYKISAFNYSSLLLLFKEIFITEEYYSELNYTRPQILDCGANIGMATLYFKWRYPDAVINSFEPDAKTFAMLEKNIRQNNLSGVTLHNKAVGSYDGTITFYHDDQTPGSLRMSVFADRMPKTKTEVPVIRLADFLEEYPADLAKIDIEGAEFDLFDDLSKTGAIKNVQEYFIEYHHKIEDQRSRMGEFLRFFESNQLEYQLTGTATRFGEFQDFLLHARPESK